MFGTGAAPLPAASGAGGALAPAPAVGAGAPPAAANPVAAAAAARHERVDRMQRMRGRKAELKKEQKALAKQGKRETHAYLRAAKKTRTLDTALILQHLCGRGENA